MKKIVTCLLVLTMLVSTITFATSTKFVNAAEELIEVTDITSSTAHVNFYGVMEDCYYSFGNVQGAKISIWFAGIDGGVDQVLYDDSNVYVDYVDLKNLPSNETIYITIEPYYTDDGGELLTGYQVVSFKTLPTNSSATVKVNKPAISKVYMEIDMLNINTKMNGCDGIEYRVYNNANKVVKKGKSTSSNTISINMKLNSIYSIQIRGYKTVDGVKKYSDWTKKKYVAPQPKIISKNKDVKRSSITIKWNKVKGAKQYVIQARKKGGKWKNVSTVKSTKNKYDLKKIGGKRIDTFKHRYEFRVITIAKKNGKKIKSTNNMFYYTYIYSK